MKNKLIFTLCSINYLAQAKTLYESVKETNPDWHFVIGLVDKNDKVNLSFLQCEVLPVDQINIDGFDEMVENYTIVELLTSVKPYYFSWFYKHYSEVNKIIYFDPDIMVFRPILSLEEKLDQYDILLTPHFTKPIEDNCLPTEIHVFNTGVYNLGFLATARSENTFDMLRWWEKKLRNDCIIDLTRGYFVDQLWMSLVPAYFDKVLIDKYPGYNMAHWNLHERTLTKNEDGYYVNGVPLVFYHFSHYSPAHADSIAAYHTRYSFSSRPDLIDIYKQYHKGLIAARFFELKKVVCYYMLNEDKKKRKRKLENFLRQALPKELKGRLKQMLRK